MLFWGILKTNKGKENFWKQRQIQQRKTLLDRTKQLSTFFGQLLTTWYWRYQIFLKEAFVTRTRVQLI